MLFTKNVLSCLGDGTASIEPHAGMRVHSPSSYHGHKDIGKFWTSIGGRGNRKYMKDEGMKVSIRNEVSVH